MFSIAFALILFVGLVVGFVVAHFHELDPALSPLDHDDVEEELMCYACALMSGGINVYVECVTHSDDILECHVSYTNFVK